MTRAELADEVARRTGFRRVDIHKVVKEVFAVMADELAKSGYVTVRDFGTLLVRRVPARKSRNPITGEPVKVPSSGYLAIRCCGPLKRRIKHAPATPNDAGQSSARREAARRNYLIRMRRKYGGEEGVSEGGEASDK